jgi:hypothetical protein
VTVLSEVGAAARFPSPEVDGVEPGFCVLANVDFRAVDVVGIEVGAAARTEVAGGFTDRLEGFRCSL